MRNTQRQTLGTIYVTRHMEYELRQVHCFRQTYRQTKRRGGRQTETDSKIVTKKET